MPNNTDIDPLSITDGKISNLANISPKKLAKATEGQILVAQADGRFVAKSLTGGISLAASGATSVTSTTTTTDGETTVVTGPAGPTGAQGPAGAQGTQGPAGSDATVTTSAVDSAGAVMETDLVQTSAGAGDASKPIKLDSTGKIDASMIDDGDISYNNITDVPSSFTPSAHKSTHATGGSDAIAPSDIGAHPAFTENNAFNKTFGNTAFTVCQGNDVRLEDSRTPTSHKASHATGGTDAISPSDIGAATNDHTHDAATTTANGFMSSGDKTKLNGIEDNATADQSASEIKTAYESNSDTNAFTDADHTKLDNIPTLGSAAQAATSDFAASGHNHNTTYLGITAKAADSDKLDGNDSSAFAAASHNHAASEITSGIIADARLPIGTNTTNLWLGSTISTELANYTPLSTYQGHGHGQYAVKASNLSDLSDAGAARTNLGLGTAAQSATGDFATSGHTHDAATTSANGFMSSADKTKLNGVQDGAEVNVQSDWNASSGGAEILNKPTVQYTSAIATGNNGLVPAAGTSGQFLAHDGTFQTPSSSAPTKFTTTITFGIGAAGTAIDFTLGTTHNGYIIQHNLGTTKFVASVRTPYDPIGDSTGNSDDATPNTWDDLFDYLYWQHMDVGYAGGNSIDTNAVLIATVNSNRLEDSNYCAIAIPNDADNNPSRLYEVTLIG